LCTQVDTMNMICTVKEKGQRTIEAARKRGDNSLIFKIVLNSASPDAWKNASMPIAAKYFDELKMIADEPDLANEVFSETMSKYDSTYLAQMRRECAFTLKTMMMELKCFSAGWEDRLKDSMNREKIITQGKILKSFKNMWDIFEM